jgi:hypothetical protein
MGIKERNFQLLPKDISLEDLVPEDNCLPSSSGEARRRACSQIQGMHRPRDALVTPARGHGLYSELSSNLSSHHHDETVAAEQPALHLNIAAIGPKSLIEAAILHQGSDRCLTHGKLPDG